LEKKLDIMAKSIGRILRYKSRHPYDNDSYLQIIIHIKEGGRIKRKSEALTTLLQ